MKYPLIFTLSWILALHGYFYLQGSDLDFGDESQELEEVDQNELSFEFETPSFFDDETEDQQMLPILMYHYVRDVERLRDPIGWNLSISPAVFDQQLKYLQEQGYETVGISELEDGFVPANSVALVFVGGYSDFYSTAFPLLQKYEMTATVSVVSGMVGLENYMSTQELKEISDAGIELAANTVNNTNLLSLGADAAKFQIQESKNFIEKTLGSEASSFVYPSGKFNSATIDLLIEAGYKIALSTQFGVADLRENLYRLPIMRIDNRDAFDGFQKKLDDARLLISPPLN